MKLLDTIPLERRVCILLLGLCLIPPVLSGGAGRLHAQTTVLPFEHFTEVNNASVYDIHQDRKGFLWVAGEGLQRYDGHHFKRYAPISGDTTSLSGLVVFVIYEDRAGTLWIGTSISPGEAGLNRYNRRTDTFTRFMHDPHDPTSIGRGVVQTMYEDSKGRFWVTPSAGGLNLMDRQTGRFTRFMHDPHDPTSLGSNDINALLEDAAGMFWLGSFEDGLNRFDPETGRALRYNTRNSCLPHNRVLGILQDDAGYLWLSEREATDLNQLVLEHIDLAYHGKRAQMPGLRVEIKRDLDVDTGTVEVVPQEIGRVLLNLLSNAFDAVHERTAGANGAYRPTVTVTTRRAGDRVELRVSDNGGGIPGAVRDRIFEPFFTTKPPGSGTGLGLSLSYDIVTQGHGGTLKVEITEGEGATFVITLPTAPPESRQPAADSQ